MPDRLGPRQEPGRFPARLRLKGFAMDTVAAFAPRRQEALTGVGVMPTADTTKALAVTATYRLSEDGRKASLLAGGDGRGLQELTLQVPASRLHLVHVDLEGVARLKLRPRFELDGEQRVVRIDDLPTYDSPPDIEDLFRDAARNHQLEHTYESERRAAKTRRREADRERRAAIAETFLTDSTQRALVHPAPTPRRCYVATPTGRLLFDLATDTGPARDVPPEAHKRFRADLRTRRDQNLQERAAQLALHDEKKRVIADWIAANGTADQQARQAAGVLPMAEAIEAITTEAFAALADRPPYEHDGVDRLQAQLRQHADHADAIVTRNDVVVTSTNGQQMTAAQWAAVQEVRGLLPDATVTLRVHKIVWKRDLRISVPPVFGVLVTQRVGPFTLRREYMAPATDARAREHADGRVEQIVA